MKEENDVHTQTERQAGYVLYVCITSSPKKRKARCEEKIRKDDGHVDDVGTGGGCHLRLHGASGARSEDDADSVWASWVNAGVEGQC